MINDLFHTYKKIIVIILICLCSVVFWFYGCRGQKRSQDDVVKWESVKKEGSYQFETADFSGTVVFGTAGHITSEKSMPVTLTITCEEKSFTGVMKITLPGDNGKGIAWQSAVKCKKGQTSKVKLSVPQLGSPSAFSFEILDSFGTSKLSEVVVTADLKGTEEEQQEEQQEDRQEVLLGVLSDEYEELSWLDGMETGQETASEADGTAMVRLVRLTKNNLPTDAAQLTALDGLLIDSFDVTTLSGRQRLAIKEWVSQGGNLLLGVESQEREVMSALSLPEKLNWVKPDGSVVEDSSLESAEIQEAAYDSGTQSVSFASFASEGFTTAVYEEGTISLPGFSFINEDFSEKEDREAAASVLLNCLVDENDRTKDSDTSLWYIKKALYAFQKSQLPNTFYYGVFFICYLFVIVLVAYYFLRRIKKREYIWVVVPALAVVFTLILFVRSMGFAGENDDSFSALRIMDTDQEREKIYLLCQNEETEEKNIDLVFDITSVVPLDYEYQAGSGDSDQVSSSGEDITVNNTSKGFDISLGESVPGMSRLLKLSRDIEETEVFQADFSTSYTAFSGTLTNCSASRFSKVILIRGSQYVILEDVKAGEETVVSEKQVKYRNGYDRDTSTFGDEEETTVMGNLLEYVQEQYMQEETADGEILVIGITEDSDFKIFSDKNKLADHVTVTVSHFSLNDETQTIVNLNQSCLAESEDTESVEEDVLEKQKTEVRYLLSDTENIWALVRNHDSFQGKIYAYNYYTGEKDLLLNEWDDCIYPASLAPYLSEEGEMIFTYETQGDSGYESAPVLSLVCHDS